MNNFNINFLVPVNFMHVKRKFLSCFLILASLMLGACTTPVMKVDEPLKADEGGIIIMSHSEFDDVRYTFQRKGNGGFAHYESPRSDAGVSFAVIKVPPGDYYISKVSFGAYYLSEMEDLLTFHVEAGQLNYFGDIFLSRAFQNNKVIPNRASVICLDKQDQLIAYLKQRFPSVIAQNKIDYTVVH